MELPSDHVEELTIPPKTAAAPFWAQCSLLWTSIPEIPRLPRPRQPPLVALHRAVHYVISPEIMPVTPLYHSVVESLHIFVVEHLAHIAQSLDILAKKLNMRGASTVRAFLAAGELEVFVAWVDGLVKQERDGIFQILGSVQVMNQSAVTAGEVRAAGENEEEVIAL